VLCALSQSTSALTHSVMTALTRLAGAPIGQRKTAGLWSWTQPTNQHDFCEPVHLANALTVLTHPVADAVDAASCCPRSATADHDRRDFRKYRGPGGRRALRKRYSPQPKANNFPPRHKTTRHPGTPGPGADQGAAFSRTDECGSSPGIRTPAATQ
jgi:hypothetical protein